jgi:hypothetical protein
VAFPLKKPLTIAYKDIGFTVLFNKLEDDGRARSYQAKSVGTGFSMSVYMEPAEKAGDTTARVRDVYWAQTKQHDKIEGEKFIDIGEFAAVEYTMSLSPQTSSKTYELFLARDGVWLDIRFSKTNFAEKDRETLESLARSVRVVPARP